MRRTIVSIMLVLTLALNSTPSFAFSFPSWYVVTSGALVVSLSGFAASLGTLVHFKKDKHINGYRCSGLAYGSQPQCCKLEKGKASHCQPPTKWHPFCPDYTEALCAAGNGFVRAEKVYTKEAGMAQTIGGVFIGVSVVGVMLSIWANGILWSEPSLLVGEEVQEDVSVNSGVVESDPQTPE